MVIDNYENDPLYEYSIRFYGQVRESEAELVKEALLAFIERELPEFMGVTVYSELEMY